MKYLNLMLCGMLACAVANAQTDSTYLDLGRMRARKEFTQTTVIKASDLAQMPFTNLSDVIRLWVNASYTDKSTMVYVIDGVMINDADAYSIYDIEEITIIQNALSQFNGAASLQTLALIQTKRAKGEQPHFSFAAQAFAVTQKEKGYNYTTELFHQYNLSGSGKIGKVAVGGSVDYLHDAMPTYNDSTKIITTPNIDRFRGHLWARTKLGKKSTLAFQGSYTPQNCNSNFSSFSLPVWTSYVRKYNESLLNATLQLQTAITSTLQNRFSAGYTTNVQKVSDSTVNTSGFNSRSELNGHQVYLNDNLSYTWNFKNWSIEPALSFNFQSLKYDYDRSYFSWPAGSHSSTTNQEKGSFLTATPMVAITYKNILNIQGGFTQDLSEIVQKDYDGSKTYPFVTVAANALPSNTKLSWKIYGSYAKMFASNNLSAFQLNDFDLYTSYFPRPYSIFSYGIWPQGPTASTNSNERYQAGSDLSFAQKRITVGYNYLKAANTEFAQFTSPGEGIYYFQGNFIMHRHQLTVTGEVLQKNTVKWRTGFLMNFFKNYSTSFGSTVEETPVAGGWTNRVNYKRISMGADLMYLFSKNLHSVQGESPNYKSILLQNVYLAYSFDVGKLHNASVYISSRNLTDSNIMPLSTDGRRFYGGGVRFDF